MDKIIENKQRSGDCVTGLCEPFTDYVPQHGIADCFEEFPLCEGTGLACVTPPGITYKLQDPDNDPERVFYQRARRSLVESSNTSRGQKRRTVPSLGPPKKLKMGDYVSKAQLEAVCYAFQSHSKFFVGEYEHVPLESKENAGAQPDVSSASVVKKMNYRQGFLLADGAGTGKTRTLARMVLEYYRSGGRKCVWIVAKKPCIAKSQAECLNFMTAVKPGAIKNLNIGSLRYNIFSSKKDDQMLMLRVTYDQLSHVENATMVEKWLGKDYDGLMIFDDFEMAKSAYCVQGSMRGKSTMRLQYNFPNARVVYSTGAAGSAVEHLLCYPRLNLWGSNTIFSNSNVFKEMVATRGVAYLEMIAMEMKMAGVYVSRHVPRSNVIVDLEQVIPSDDFACAYGRATELWALLLAYMKSLKRSFQEKFGDRPAELQKLNELQKTVYESCKSFFISLIVSSKIAAMETSARRELLEDKSIVIFVHHNGEVHMTKFREDGNDGRPFSNALFILRSAMLSMGIPLGCERTYIRNNVEVKIGQCKDVADCIGCGQLAKGCIMSPDVVVGALQRFKADKRRLLWGDFGQDMEMGNVWPDYTVGSYSVAHHQLLKDPRNVSWSIHPVRRNPSLAQFARLYHELSLLLPINPLDEIRNRFENPIDLRLVSHSVADLTSRKHRYMYDKIENTWKFALKGDCEESATKDTEAFATGKKHVVVISTASSVGVNLFATTKDKRHGRQLVHYTVEVPYNAETCAQQLGRAVSVQQDYPTIYRILGSAIHGEKRTLSQLGWRLKSSGAVFRGHAAGNLCSGIIKEDWLYSINGCTAINAALGEVKNEHPRLYQALKMLDCKRVDGIPERNGRRVEIEIPKRAHDAISSFLNQFFLIPPKIQDELWLIIEKKFIELEKFNPTYRSIKCLPVNLESVKLVGTQMVGTADKPSTVYRFGIMRYATWEYVLQLKAAHPSLGFFKCREASTRDMLYAVYQIDDRKIVIRPFDRNEATLPANVALEPVDQVLAETEWRKEVDQIQTSNATCEHELTGGIKCNKLKELYGRTCTYHWGVTEVLLITGHMIEIARKLEERWSIPAQMCKITWIVDGIPNHAAGLLVSCENCKYSIDEVLGWLEG